MKIGKRGGRFVPVTVYVHFTIKYHALLVDKKVVFPAMRLSIFIISFLLLEQGFIIELCYFKRRIQTKQNNIQRFSY